MGIDKSNVRVVVHFNMPASPEHWLQEAGRGGRDNKDATAIVLFSCTDWYIRVLQVHADAGVTSGEVKLVLSAAQRLVQQRKLQGLASMVVLCQQQSCLRASLLSYFDSHGARCSESRSLECSGCTHFTGAEVRSVNCNVSDLGSLAVAVSDSGLEVTPSQLLDLYRGVIAKPLAAVANLRSLIGFGTGEKFAAGDARRLLHVAEAAGVLERFPNRAAASERAVSWRLRPTSKLHSLLTLSAASTNRAPLQLSFGKRVKAAKSDVADSKLSSASTETASLLPQVQLNWHETLAALTQWRDTVCARQSLPALAVVSDDVLLAVALRSPVTVPGLMCVPGFGARATRFSEEIVAVVRSIHVRDAASPMSQS